MYIIIINGRTHFNLRNQKYIINPFENLTKKWCTFSFKDLNCFALNTWPFCGNSYFTRLPLSNRNHITENDSDEIQVYYVWTTNVLMGKSRRDEAHLTLASYSPWYADNRLRMYLAFGTKFLPVFHLLSSFCSTAPASLGCWRHTNSYIY